MIYREWLTEKTSKDIEAVLELEPTAKIPIVKRIARVISGWYSPEQMRLLYLLAKNTRPQGCFLEIGSYAGRSTAVLAAAVRDSGRSHVYAVDVWHNMGPTLGKFVKHLLKLGLRSEVRVIEADSTLLFDGTIGINDKIALIHIDGDHSFQAVERDIRMATRLLQPGGMIILHDYLLETEPGVKQAVDKWAKEEKGYAICMVYGLAIAKQLAENTSAGPRDSS